VEIPAQELAGYRQSYRNLSYSLAQAGYEVNNNLPGEDKPETAAAIMEDAFSWAGLPVPD